MARKVYRTRRSEAGWGEQGEDILLPSVVARKARRPAKQLYPLSLPSGIVRNAIIFTFFEMGIWCLVADDYASTLDRSGPPSKAKGVRELARGAIRK